MPLAKSRTSSRKHFYCGDVCFERDALLAKECVGAYCRVVCKTAARHNHVHTSRRVCPYISVLNNDVGRQRARRARRFRRGDRTSIDACYTMSRWLYTPAYSCVTCEELWQTWCRRVGLYTSTMSANIWATNEQCSSKLLYTQNYYRPILSASQWTSDIEVHSTLCAFMSS